MTLSLFPASRNHQAGAATSALLCYLCAALLGLPAAAGIFVVGGIAVLETGSSACSDAGAVLGISGMGCVFIAVLTVLLGSRRILLSSPAIRIPGVLAGYLVICGIAVSVNFYGSRILASRVCGGEGSGFFALGMMEWLAAIAGVVLSSLLVLLGARLGKPRAAAG